MRGAKGGGCGGEDSRSSEGSPRLKRGRTGGRRVSSGGFATVRRTTGRLVKTLGGEIRCWLLGRAVVVAGRRRRFRRLGLEKEEEEEENAFVGLGSGRTGPGK